MWVRVKNVKDDGTIVGQLHNTPTCYPKKWGAQVKVKPDEVLDITVGEGATQEGARLFTPHGRLPRTPIPYRPADHKFNWTNMAAAVLAGVTLATLVSSYARNA
jgi:hypothetical protein